jgi:AcrR family transcriptional regulator
MKDTLQEQLITVRRHRILDSAAKVFAQKGFHQATIKDIAQEAGIAYGSVYTYFESKTALLLGIFDRMRESLQPDEDALNLDPNNFRGFLTAYFRYPLIALKDNNFALFKVVVSEMMVNDELRELYLRRILEPTLLEGEQMLQQWSERHAIKPKHVALTTRAISSIVLGLLIARILGDSILEAQWDEIPAFMADLIIDGIGEHHT